MQTFLVPFIILSSEQPVKLSIRDSSKILNVILLQMAEIHDPSQPFELVLTELCGFLSMIMNFYLLMLESVHARIRLYES